MPLAKIYASQILLGLAATVSAIDIYGHRDSSTCGGGGYAVCMNAAPDSCCVRASGDIYRSIQFRAIPTNWKIIGRAFNGGDCRNLYYVVQSQGRQNICLGNGGYSGGNYGFANRKRSEGADEACPATGGCASVQEADLIVFENGSSYNLTNLDDGLYTEMVSTIIRYTDSFCLPKSLPR